MKITAEMYDRLDRDELLRLNAYVGNVRQHSIQLSTLSFISLLFFFLFLSQLYWDNLVLRVAFLSVGAFTSIFAFIVFIFSSILERNKISEEIEKKYFNVELKTHFKKKK